MSATPGIRVLVVDDSAFGRKVLRLSLDADPRIEVVGTAHDGLDALEKITLLAPDVVTLDLMMPNLDGVGVLKSLATQPHAPRVVVVTSSGEDSELAVEALQLGAVDLVIKPTALATDKLYAVAGPLVEAVVRAAKTRRPVLTEPAPRPSPPAPQSSRVSLIVIGVSTGGPQALAELLSRLPASLPVPIAIALHIPGDYTEALARRLDRVSPLRVQEARTGLRLGPGDAVLARGGMHLSVKEELETRVHRDPYDAPYFPSVNVLFESAAEACGARTMGVVLTGMGDDGLDGARKIVDAGGLVLTESELSCVVYGMPRAVKEAGLSSGEATIDQMAGEILRRL
ncbi:MAG: chemotaxis-specific protein-glutamate methyltransferase CheB [Archangium sp.]